MIMNAAVIDVQWGRLLVLDLDTRQRVLVNLRETSWLHSGDLVRIWYNGVMTKSIPPQITAQRIVVLPQDTVPPSALPPVFFPPCLPGVCPPFFRPPARTPFRPLLGPGPVRLGPGGVPVG